MVASSYTKSDGVYVFNFPDGKQALYPESSIILTDDESGLISVKGLATRKVLFSVKAN